MLKYRELESPASCLNRARDDEPVFVLRAHDKLAPGTVRDWAHRYIVSKGGWQVMSGRQHLKYQEAMKLAEQMEQWQAANP